MPEFESLSFALLIPFAICFALIFVVCCFAEEIKDICRMPSPLPRSYLAPEHGHSNQHRNRRPLRQNWPQNEEVRNLILSEEGRSRNVSESSADYQSASNVLANSVSNLNFSRGAGGQMHQNVLLLPQTTIPNAGQRTGIPNTSCVVLQPVVNTILIQPSARLCKMQPLGQFTVHNSHRNTNRNFVRNLTIHASASSKELHSCVKEQQSQNDMPSNKNSNSLYLNRNESAPYLLNSYLSKGSSNINSTPLSHTVVNKEEDTNQTDQLR